ncbi:MAG: ROK family protein [Verrucomicrobiota bacterium]|nr:ROK family protein [Verrucomicrobiota bacterium]
MRKILVVDVGGTHVKLMLSRNETRKFDSGPSLTPKRFVAALKKDVDGWVYDAISIGFPAPVSKGEIVKEPYHLAKGWIGYDFAKPLGKPVRVINDAAMQALGSYRRDRTLFLGLGTGLGSALIWGSNLLPLELGHLPYDGAVIEDVLGNEGLRRLGQKAWRRKVLVCLNQLKIAMIAERVVVGGGNARLFKSLPKGFERGDNRLAYCGGVRLWENNSKTRRPKWTVM